VVINQAFSAQTITQDSGDIGRNVNFTGSTGLTFSTSATRPYVYGSLTFATGMAVTVTGTTSIYFRGRGVNSTLTSNGVTLPQAVMCDTINGTVLLGDNLSETRQNTNVDTQSGTFDLNGFNLTTTRGIASATGTTTFFRSGVITITAEDTRQSVLSFPNGTVNSGTSTIIVNPGSTTIAHTFDANSNTLNNVTINTDKVTLQSAGTYNLLTANVAGMTNGLLMLAGVTHTVSGFATNGSAGNLAKLVSTVGASPATISCASGTISVDYMSIQDSAATGGATFYAGANSTNVSGNTGWIFSAPPQSSIVPMMRRQRQPIYQR
jgi:hypothetical protein